ncbi:NlpC/P60 family protein [uncultured Jatrophihabitans sp.]|uniref:C40 family peptidase n=1 Tax=uncultured Jatrophihabitans sp. TaxID=1610747 RepID=UPI0035CAFD28
MILSRTGRRRIVAASAVAMAAASLLTVASSTAAAPKPPPPPKVTQQQVAAAAAHKTAVAEKVGALSGQIAAAQSELQQLVGKRELAEQKVALAFSELRGAKAAAATSKRRETAAQAGVDEAHTNFVRYLQATYMAGDVDGITGSLLTAQDPGSLLDRGTLEEYAADSQVSAIGDLQRATVTRSNAEAAARRAVRSVAKKAAAAKATQEAADNAVAAQQAQRAALQRTLAASQVQLDAAQSELATLNNRRAAYVAYKVELARQARIRAEKARQARLAAQAAQAAAAAAAAARARRARHHGGGAPVTSGPTAPTGGSWTAAKGRRAAARALSQLGVPYAWAGGGASGPSYGVCDPGNGAPNDCNVVGFDCSGLVMYAWGKGWAHYAATQYSQAGSVHPAAGSFEPGDLLFWSSDGTRSGIEHVAIYLGGGNVVQAPESGKLIEITPWDQVMWGYYGATRPLT